MAYILGRTNDDGITWEYLNRPFDSWGMLTEWVTLNPCPQGYEYSFADTSQINDDDAPEMIRIKETTRH